MDGGIDGDEVGVVVGEFLRRADKQQYEACCTVACEGNPNTDLKRNNFGR